MPAVDILLDILPALSPAFLAAVIVGAGSFVLIIFFSVFKWTVWLVISFVVAILQVSYGAYQGSCILFDLVVLSVVKTVLWIYKNLQSINFASTSASDKNSKQLWQAHTYREWSACAAEMDKLAGDPGAWNNGDDGFPAARKLAECVEVLRTARLNGDYKLLLFHMPGYIKRNHLGMDDIGLFTESYTSTKTVITDYLKEIEECATYLRTLDNDTFPISEKIGFFGKLFRNLGQSALCLSGGGALSMYHMGVIRALIESGNYSKVEL